MELSWKNESRCITIGEIKHIEDAQKNAQYFPLHVKYSLFY